MLVTSSGDERKKDVAAETKDSASSIKERYFLLFWIIDKVSNVYINITHDEIETKI